MNAVIYARQSSGKEENSESIEAQIASCTRYCREHKLKIIGTYSDPNTSGRTYPDTEKGRQLAAIDSAFCDWFEDNTTTKRFRPGLGAVLNALENGCRLVVDDFTHLCRPVSGSFLGIFLIRFLQSQQISVYCVKTGSFDPNSLTDNMFSTLQNGINDQQLVIQKRKSMDVRRKLQDSGTMPAGTRAFGFVKTGKHKYKFDAKLADIVKFVFSETLKRRPYAAITRDACEMYRKSCGKNFYTSHFYHIVSNPLYSGYMRDTSGKLIKWNDLECKPLISFDEWMKTREILEEQRKAPTPARYRTLIFSGFLYCGTCGARLVTSIDRGNMSYHCFQGAMVRHDPGCSKSRIGIDIPFGRKSYVGLKQAMAPFLVLAQYKFFQESCGLNKFRQQKAELEAECEHLKECDQSFTEMFTTRQVSRERYEMMVANLTTKMSKNAREIASVSAKLNKSHLSEMMQDKFWGDFESIMKCSIPDEKYRDLLHNSIKKITCFETHIYIETEWGNFQLDRCAFANRRHMPKFTYRILRDSTANPKNIADCKIEVTYEYPDQRKKRLVINLPVLEIYEDNNKADEPK